MKSRSKTIEIGDMRKPFLSTDKESYPIWKRYVQWKHDAYLFACIGTAGILFILSKMYPDFKLWLLTELCNPSEADVVSIYEGPRNKTIAVEKYVINDDHSVCSFDKNCVRYVASSQENWAVKEVPEVPVNFLDFLSGKAVSDGASRSLSRSRYGDNKMALPVASFWDILAVTVVHPFYLFQYFSVTIW